MANWRGLWPHRLSMVATVLFAALLVSSLLFVLHQAHQSDVGTQGNSFHSSKVTGGLNTLFSLHMIDASTGWSLSKQAVLRTTDGGSHWQNVSPPHTRLTQDSIADFFSASLAWIATPRTNAATTQILHTADGGQTWQRVTIQAAFPRQISFIDSQHGWLLVSWQQPGGPAETISVLRTVDAGKTWTTISNALAASTDGPPLGQLPFGGQKSGIRFLNASTGWVTGTVLAPNLTWLYMTYDGGSTWHQQPLPMPPGIVSARLSILSPTFFSPTDGILPINFVNSATDSNIATAVYVTHDGGNTWQSTTPLPGAFNIVDFADSQHGWATDGSVLYRTSDGGQHWKQLSTSESLKHISQLDFVSDQIGWAISSPASNSSSLLKTVDGGYTWTVISSTVS
jgi:photosystem II stability/assembly factor-like uncharacterized protein